MILSLIFTTSLRNRLQTQHGGNSLEGKNHYFDSLSRHMSDFPYRLGPGQPGFSPPRRGKNNDKAHPPIHPTAHAPNITGDKKRVYEYITRRFLASCSRDAEGFMTTVSIDCGEEAFTANGKSVDILADRKLIIVKVFWFLKGITLMFTHTINGRVIRFQFSKWENSFNPRCVSSGMGKRRAHLC